MKTPPTFEEARRELEQIVVELESGQADLEKALSLWERGEELYRRCLAQLDAAQAKVDKLAGGSESSGQPGSQRV